MNGAHENRLLLGLALAALSSTLHSTSIRSSAAAGSQHVIANDPALWDATPVDVANPIKLSPPVNPSQRIHSCNCCQHFAWHFAQTAEAKAWQTLHFAGFNSNLGKFLFNFNRSRPFVVLMAY